jgi:hypothetical protein
MMVWAEGCALWSAGVRGAIRCVARGRCWLERGLASAEFCSSLHHLISGRTMLARYPHCACVRRGSHEGWDPSTSRLFVLAQGWHGHHPHRADRGGCRGAGVVSLRFEHRMFGNEPGDEIAPERHDQFTRQGDDRDPSDPTACLGGALAEPPAESCIGLMSQPQRPGQCLVPGFATAMVALLGFLVPKSGAGRDYLC